MASNYFNKSVLENRGSLKERLSLILNKFCTDNDLKKMFDETINAIPIANLDKPIKIIVSSLQIAKYGLGSQNYVLLLTILFNNFFFS